MRLVLILVAGVLLGGCSLFGIRSGYEQPAYTVSDNLDDRVEIREYAPRLAAETPRAAGDEDSRDEAFRVLFDYINGANQGQAEVEMTAPVEVGAPEQVEMTAPVETGASQQDGKVMRFFLPASYTLGTAPKPTDPRVKIVEVPQATVAVLRFSGLWDEQTFEAREAELLGLLDGSAWRAAGSPSTLFYDPPWTLPFLRRNEVAVPVVKVAPA
jgi:SOUL heme-binding protein